MRIERTFNTSALLPVQADERGREMSNYKYFATYVTPPYGGGDLEYVMGVTSVAGLKALFKGFQSGSVWCDEFRQNPDGFYVPWRLERYLLAPDATDLDYMDVYSAVPTHNGQYLASNELEYRIRLGERGGLVIE